MKIIQCPKCKSDVTINVAQSISEDGEVFICPSCHYKFRFVEK